MKRFLDTRFPRLSQIYRRIRDYRSYRSLAIHQTSLGFQLYGGTGLDASRVASSEIDIVKRFFEISQVFVDIGAHVGLFTCLAAQAHKQVIAVEPHPKNLQYLCKNIQLNDLLNVEVFGLALSDAPGIGDLYGSHQGASLLNEWGASPASAKTSHLVPINTLDNLVGERFSGEKIVIKIDVEGNEYKVLQGAVTTLQRNPPPIWLMEHGLTENFGGAMNPFFLSLFEVFWENKYKAYSIESEMKLVERTDVERWIRNAKRDFGDVNFVFLRDEDIKILSI